MSPLWPAGPAAFPDVVLESILEYGLCVPNLVKVSSVCRRWMKATQEPMSWSGKTVFIEGARGITREQLSAWLPRWRWAQRLHLTYSQMDLLAAPLTAPPRHCAFVAERGPPCAERFVEGEGCRR